jgi:drug/metabolite transporter (DMT)-like permease
LSRPTRVWFLLPLALLCLSQAGNLVRLADAPVLAIAFHRLLGGLLLVAPLGLPQLLKHREGRDLAILALGGVFFGAHFVAWFHGVKHTSVANGMLLFAANPVFAALGARIFLGEPVGGLTRVAIAVGLLGIVLTTGGDLGFRPERLEGDLCSLLSGVLFAGYLVCGRFTRRRLGVWGAFAGTLGSAWVVVALCVVVLRVPLVGFEPSTWAALAALVIFPTFVGHGLLNWSMRYAPSAILSGLTLTEPLLGSLVAWRLFDEGVSPWSWGGYALVALSALLLLRAQIRGPGASEAVSTGN